MSAQHTPGPWGISSESPTIIKQYDFLGESCVLIGSAAGYDGSPFFPTQEAAVANARLIALAPTLLALLVESQTSIGGDWRERRDAAIAATGSAPAPEQLEKK